MNYHVLRLLQPQELSAVVSFVNQQTFKDGKATAHGLARMVKNNLQTERTSTDLSQADRILIGALQRSLEFQRFAQPKRIVVPMFSRYDPGMEYGPHIDDAVMSNKYGGDPLRSDLAMTIFLSPPSSYDGGELVIEMPLGEQEIKLDAGEAVVYSSSSIHHVNRVTRGSRLAAVAWVQSTVRSEPLRAILFDLIQAVDRSRTLGDHDLSLRLGKSYHNLLRYAAEP
jgi:PKHD-type hydroxylase